MTREAFLNKAVELCIGCAEETGVYFIEPMWKDILIAEGCQEDLDNPDNKDVFMVLDLAVKKANARTDRTKYVMDWLYDLLTTTIEPAALQEENELVKNVIDYMKLNNELKNKEKELNLEEKKLDDRRNVSKLMPGMNFKKRI